ncbi:hypothetical protein FB451DRAFT_1396026 [Mycena latifolia]|nr:hypothetical protein FB451DRAFT_1396026 [Mycena latifolia]
MYIADSSPSPLPTAAPSLASVPFFSHSIANFSPAEPAEAATTTYTIHTSASRTTILPDEATSTPTVFELAAPLADVPVPTTPSQTVIVVKGGWPYSHKETTIIVVFICLLLSGVPGVICISD